MVLSSTRPAFGFHLAPTVTEGVQIMITQVFEQATLHFGELVIEWQPGVHTQNSWQILWNLCSPKSSSILTNLRSLPSTVSSSILVPSTCLISIISRMHGSTTSLKEVTLRSTPSPLNYSLSILCRPYALRNARTPVTVTLDFGSCGG